LLAIPTALLGALPVGLNPRLVALAVGAVMDGIAGLSGPVRTRGLAAGLRIAGPGGRPLALRAWLVVAPRRRLGCTGPGHAWGLRRARRLDTRGLAVRAGAGGPGPVRAGAHGLLAAASITCGLPAALPRRVAAAGRGWLRARPQAPRLRRRRPLAGLGAGGGAAASRTCVIARLRGG